MARYNDLDPKYWKEYTDINTDSLCIIDKRDNSGVHSFWGSQYSDPHFFFPFAWL